MDEGGFTVGMRTILYLQNSRLQYELSQGGFMYNHVFEQSSGYSELQDIINYFLHKTPVILTNSFF